jgi:predicted neutral ceramidase superfamily lipid hydrolase
MSLKRLPRHVTKEATPTFHCNGYDDESLKRLPRHVTVKATMTGDESLKRLLQHVNEKATLAWNMFLLN